MQNSVATSPSASLAILFARLCVVILFGIAAYNKIKGYDFFVGYFTKLGIPMPSLTTPFIIAAEIIGALCMLVGYKLRIVGPALALFAIIAGSFAHNNWADLNQLNHFLKNIGLFGTLALFYVTGAGAYSIDKT